MSIVQFQKGSVNLGFGKDSTSSVPTNYSIDEGSHLYANAHIVRTPQDAIDTIRSPHDSPQYENIDDRNNEPCQSVERCDDRCPYTVSETDRNTRNSMPFEAPPDIPDVAPQNSDLQESQRISGVEQIIINDDIYYCPLDDSNPSARSSDDEEIYENNE